MPEVTIDADDLEAILFAAGAANANPEATRLLKKHDAQFDHVHGKLTDAIRKVGDAWRKAKRAQEWPERFVVDITDLNELLRIVARGGRTRFGMTEDINNPIDRRLITKGLVEYGIFREMIVWTNTGADQLEHAERRVRLTQDGIDAMKAGIREEMKGGAKENASKLIAAESNNG